MKDGVTLKWIKAGMKGQGAALAFVLVFCVAQAALAAFYSAWRSARSVSGFSTMLIFAMAPP